MFAAVGLQAMRLEFGYAMGSLVAVGGITSASIVLALKETMENLLGGLLVKFNDKFRPGDFITIPGSKTTDQGRVLEISFLTTTLLLDDNSSTSIPNRTFTAGEIINWSRTKYRLFKTSFTVPLTNLKALPAIIESVRAALIAIPEVEKTYREVVVAASGFDATNIKIDVKLHFRANKGVEELKTEAVTVIANCIKQATANAAKEDKKE